MSFVETSIETFLPLPFVDESLGRDVLFEDGFWSLYVEVAGSLPRKHLQVRGSKRAGLRCWLPRGQEVSQQR